MRRHHYHSPWKRGAYSLGLVISIVFVGTLGFHLIEGSSYLDAFYLTSMIATAQGPAQVPATPPGKIFAAMMAFISMGAVVAAAGFLFGPFLGQLWRIGHDRWDKEKNSR